MSRVAGLGALVAAFVAAAWTVVSPDDAALALLLVAGALVVAGVSWLENGMGSSKELVLIATLAAAAAAGRVLFAAVPNVQPVTVIAVVSGVALGPRAGAAVGGLASIVAPISAAIATVRAKSADMAIEWVKDDMVVVSSLGSCRTSQTCQKPTCSK